MTEINKEWQALHQSFLKYELLAFIIKGMALLTFLVFWTGEHSLLITLVVIAILWLHEGIVRRVQSRVYQRLLVVEGEKLAPELSTPLHYTEFDKNRPNPMQLVIQYVSSSLKPTVAVSYAAFILVSIMVSIL